MTPVEREEKRQISRAIRIEQETQGTANTEEKSPDSGFIHSSPNDEEVRQHDSHKREQQRGRNTQSLSREPDIKPERVSPTTWIVDLTKSPPPDSEIEIAAVQPVQKSTRTKRKNADSRAPIPSIERPQNESVDEQQHRPTISLLDQPEEREAEREADANQEDLDDTPERDLWDVPSYHGSSPNEGPDLNVGNPSDSNEAHPAPQAQTGRQTKTPIPKRRRRRRYANAQPTRRSRRLRGKPPEFLGLEPVRRKRRARK
ncbi:hypothetical protein VTN77DRAFT_890 [Rasamsonia byssochlamydoides]|uniref:uncharacterized protein n=1 Tax=Rasamsonia byssochlamydoides TaxID=89139 RepID=UPI0037433B45